MLFGSLSGLMPLALGLPVTSTGDTLGCCGVGEVAGVPVSPGFCPVGVVSQAESSSVAAAMVRKVGIARMTGLLLLDERAPGGLTHVAGGDAQPLLDASVGGHRRQHAAPAD